MDLNLSKRDKKIARACIDKGLDAEFLEGIKNAETVISKWKEGKFTSNREAYHTLFSAVNEKDMAIAKRYDGLSGSKWLITVAMILKDGYITIEDIKPFSDLPREAIMRFIAFE